MADRMYYFYRCRRCFSLITRLQMQKAMESSAVICSCGSGTAGPTNPMKWEWLKPAVLKMTLLMLMGQLDPAPEASLPVPVPMAVQSVPAMSADELALGEDDEDVR